MEFQNQHEILTRNTRNNDVLLEYRPVGISTCRNIDLLEYRPVGISTCRNIDLLEYRPVGISTCQNRPIDLSE